MGACKTGCRDFGNSMDFEEREKTQKCELQGRISAFRFDAEKLILVVAS